MTFTNLEKYVYSKNEPPTPLPPAKSKVFSRQKVT